MPVHATSKRAHAPWDVLDDRTLVREFAYIDGRWCAADSGEVRAVDDPATGNLVGHVPALGGSETQRAIEAAERAFGQWRRLLPQERAAHLRAWHDEIQANREDLARLMTLEQGKPLAEARGEIDYAASFVDWYAEEARRINGETIASHLPDRRMATRREPIGVTAAITPWNFPSAMITRKVAAALASGCTMIVRPASETPFSALALAELADRAGIPAGVFSVLTGEAGQVVGTLMASPAVRGVSFTGSTRVGKLLIEQGAATVKRMAMELGGHAPFIVFPDVDLDRAVDAAVGAKFQTSGQDCLAANRIYIHDSVYEPFVTRFTERVSRLPVGNGFTPGVEIGPLINANAAARCQKQVDDAVGAGARLTFGGKVHEAGPAFYTPTVLADVTDGMLIAREETFGPVAAVLPFSDEAEVIGRANRTEYGLMAYLYTRDHDRVCRMERELHYGMLGVNCVKVTGAPIPFGGVKASGLGREGGHWGLDEFLEVRYSCAAYAA
jgi:aspartate-semialdehyde dehydrogenase